MRISRMLAVVAVTAAVLAATAVAQGDVVAPIEQFPRDQTVIIHNPEGVIANPGWFNIWVTGGGGTSNGLHQLAMDTFWFIDPNAGIVDPVYDSLASGPAEYNEDFTEMVVRLREGIYWSDGVEFTADDVVFTVETQMVTPGTSGYGAYSTQVSEVTAVDRYTVHFRLRAPNSRFHTVFAVRWNAQWIMPKHVFEAVDDILSFDYNPPLSLGPYTLHSFDPNGNWYIWQKRADWDRTSFREVGEPVPQFVIYRNNIAIDNRLIEMRNGNLDMIHDLSPEGTFAIMRQDPQVQGWFDGFPYAHPDPTLPAFIFNHQNDKFQDARVRWALALMLDARALSMASYRGAATLSAISIPPTGTHPDDYHAPLQEYLINFELDTGTRVIRPYDPDIGLQVADMVRAEFGDMVPTDPDVIRRSFGYGWWRQDLQAAGELLESAGFTRSGNQWIRPNGQPFTFTLMVPASGVINRLGTMAAQLWTQAGVNVSAEVAPDSWQRQGAGDYEANVAWHVETYGGHPDLAFFLDSHHSEFIVEPGENQPARNWMRWSDPRLDEIIEQIRGVDFNDPRALELGHEYVKLHLQEMPSIPVMSYNVFSVQSNRFWTGWPDAENNYANPVTNWSNGRYILTQIRPVTD
jgi:peptide/nickel transport system substrate-binding protein